MAREGVDGCAAACKGEKGREVVDVALPVRAMEADGGTGVFEREGGESVKFGPFLPVVTG